MDIEKIKIEEFWKEILKDEFQKEYFQKIKDFLVLQKKMGKIIFPDGKDIFNAFNFTAFDTVKVVIIGQDPYHGEGQANGLCFSVKKNVKIPPSLRNIYKELNSDIGFKIPNHGNLSNWAKQGVFMLNSILTVEKHKPASHANIGRQIFTNRVIELLSEKKSGLVFLLWGAFAKNQKYLIDTSKHYILESTHPSPFSAHKGFLGCGHFSKVNKYLNSLGKESIIRDID